MTVPAEPPANGPEGEGTPPEPKPGPQGGTPPDLDEKKFSQRDVNRLEKGFKEDYRSKREHDEELIELGRNAKEALDAKRPLEERVAAVTGEKATIARERDDALIENKRMKLAGQARLDPDLWDRVRGDTDEAILEDIEKLKGFSKTPQGGDQQQQPPGRGGARPNQQQGRPSQGDDTKTGSVAAGRDLHAKFSGNKQGAAAP